jgi:hypothetical protein
MVLHRPAELARVTGHVDFPAHQARVSDGTGGLVRLDLEFCRFAKMKKSGEGPLAAKGAPAIPGSPGRTTQDRPLAFAWWWTVPNFVPTTKPEGVLLAVCGTRLTLSSRYTCIAES